MDADDVYKVNSHKIRATRHDYREVARRDTAAATGEDRSGYPAGAAPLTSRTIVRTE